jgi:hypothetical protein
VRKNVIDCSLILDSSYCDTKTAMTLLMIDLCRSNKDMAGWPFFLLWTFMLFLYANDASFSQLPHSIITPHQLILTNTNKIAYKLRTMDRLILQFIFNIIFFTIQQVHQETFLQHDE